MGKKFSSLRVGEDIQVKARDKEIPSLQYRQGEPRKVLFPRLLIALGGASRRRIGG